MVNMKRLTALLLAAVLALSLAACGGDGAGHTTTGENEPSSDPSNTDYIDDTESTNPSNDNENENETYWEVGDTIILDSVEFTLDSYQFEQCLYNVRNGDYLSPVDLSSLSEDDLMYNSLTTDNPYYADDEHIFLLLSFTQKNIGKESVQIIAPESDMLVIYSDGYTFDFLSDIKQYDACIPAEIMTKEEKRLIQRYRRISDQNDLDIIENILSRYDVNASSSIPSKSEKPAG